MPNKPSAEALERRVHLSAGTVAVQGRMEGPPPPLPPAVRQVYLSGSQWQPRFRQYLDDKGMGSATYGYAIPDGPAQSGVLPWINLDQVSIAFTANVQVDADDLKVRGLDVASYALDGAAFTYDPPSRTATWRLAAGQVFGNDRIVIDLDADGVKAPGGDGESLDGEWANPAGELPGDDWPSGDGTAGGDFRLRLNLLPGDVTGDGIVLARDFADVKKKFFKDTLSTPEGTDADYSPFYDIEGSGAILAFDYAEVKKRFFNELPPPDDTLLYSFETGLEGFQPTGFPLPQVAVDTAGATEGSQSLRFSLSQPETFSGALSQFVNNALLLDPGTDAIAVDVTIRPGEEQYAGAGFARLGVMYFGSIPSQGVFGIPVQTNGESERDLELAPGTYTIVIPLISTAGTPFRDSFGTEPDKLEIVSGFQFYINKTNDDAMTVYFDNVRVVGTPEPASAQAATLSSSTGAVPPRPAVRPMRRKSAGLALWA